MFEFEHLREFETICQNTIASTAQVEEFTKKRGGKSREPVPFMRSWISSFTFACDRGPSDQPGPGDPSGSRHPLLPGNPKLTKASLDK